MKKKQILFFIVQLIFFAIISPILSYSIAEVVQVGDTIEFVNINNYIDHFSSIDMKKNEFETTIEYNKRIKNAVDKVNLKGVLIETTKDLNQLKYDAENQRFYFNSYFFSNTTYTFVVQALKNSGQFEKLIVSDQVAYLSVGPTGTKSLGTYQAQNAMGANFTIQKGVAHRVFLVSYRDFDNKFNFLQTVIVLDEGRIGDSVTEREIAYLNIERERAKNIKEKLKTGVMVDLVYPYYVSGEYKITPTSTNPRDVLVTSDNFIVNFKCGFITDSKGKVLKVVETIP
ncbi:MAG: hypothetical protein HQK65_22945 [Desulfamplus sp.]|nr:hypothetical protein [Desulfamplus sp.]